MLQANADPMTDTPVPFSLSVLFLIRNDLMIQSNDGTDTKLHTVLVAADTYHTAIAYNSL